MNTITTHTHTTEYTNTTDQLMMLANGDEVLAVGRPEIEQVERRVAAQYPWWEDDLGGTPWSLIEYVEPGETVRHTWSALHIPAPTPEEAAAREKAWQDLLGIGDLPSDQVAK